MPSPPPEARRQHGAFTVGQAYAVGWTPSSLRHGVARSRLDRVRRGVYGLHDPGMSAAAVHARAAAAVALVDPTLAVSHASAALMMRTPVLVVPPLVQVTTPRVAGRRGQVRGARVHHARIGRGDRVRVNGLRTLSPARTVADVSRADGVDAGLVVGDAMLRSGLCSRPDLDRELERCRGWPGLGTARTVIAHVDARSESPLESVSRLRMAMGAIPAPRLQATVRDSLGRFVGRVDFCWDEHGVVGEADGLGKYTDVGVLRAEKLRQERLEQLGLIIVRWSWADLADFEPVLHRLRDAFGRGSRADRGTRRWVLTDAG